MDHKDKTKKSLICSSAAEYLTFIAATGGSEDAIEIRYVDENIWLTQKMMAELYDVEVHTINEHIKKIFTDWLQGQQRPRCAVPQVGEWYCEGLYHPRLGHG